MNRILSSKDIIKFMDDVLDLHDSVLREFYLNNRAHVSADKYMIMNFNLSAIALFQSQLGPIAIRIIFEEISYIKIEKQFEIEDCNIEFKKNGNIFFETDNGKTTIECKSIMYEIDKTSLGVSNYLGNEIPRTKMVKAVNLGSNVRQCTNCSNAFEHKDCDCIATCPECLEVTYIEDTTK